MARWIPSTLAIASLFVFPASGAEEPPPYEDKLIEGGKRLNVQQFLAGHHLTPGEQLG